jgi:hypothetical protein
MIYGQGNVLPVGRESVEHADGGPRDGVEHKNTARLAGPSTAELAAGEVLEGILSSVDPDLLLGRVDSNVCSLRNDCQELYTCEKSWLRSAWDAHSDAYTAIVFFDFLFLDGNQQLGLDLATVASEYVSRWNLGGDFGD